ncbi:MAG: S-adenosylmethionine:tRNA ribosyltransferase-isomerase [uncultured Acidimicrobiales bacterium]|uniref:S-adenosylmethionine:tRNA ribosyltransferase-isomerase n=1 Tax=uncultured Acidimicrobiales bacterium TaxID=310071 RepID=A0A6J4IQH0_9ACTN|nr:MAG: S-adenosylmethionine:tRNA ribosyltransferase-isomerase [uncultured Acidimicrobiales bacterium]
MAVVEGLAGAGLDYHLPEGLEAHAPPEMLGITRDAVRLMVSTGPDAHVHTTFSDLPRFLRAGDLLVLNTSATVPAALPVLEHDAAPELVLHLSTPLPGGLWLTELRRPEGFGTAMFDAAGPGDLQLPGGASAELLAPFGDGRRLWFTALHLREPLLPYLARHGRPIRYAYAGGAWPLSAYQNVYASDPGSAELASAGRPFTADVLTRLVTKGVRIAPLVLHTGVSSAEANEAPAPERFAVPLSTARLVNETKHEGGRVIAVGTTVVRALETVTDETGAAHPGDGWTELVVTPARGVRAVDAMITGWHPPRASHLLLLEALAGRPMLEGAYASAVEARYRWHEFGDSHLLLPA